MEKLFSLFESPEKAAVVISAVSALIAVISVLVAVIENIKNQKHYKDSQLPLLSMRLVDYDGILYLHIKNTGKSLAHHIRIKPTGIINNSDHTLFASGLFAVEFELYPEESVQGQVSLISRSICNEPFPQITVDVSYRKGTAKKEANYSRTVTYSPAFDKKVSVDTNLNFKDIESSVKSISRSANRTANYLDGKNLYSFDNIESPPESNLRNDLLAANQKEEEPVSSRAETPDNALENKENENHADA